jgi:hypothetical protein
MTRYGLKERSGATPPLVCHDDRRGRGVSGPAFEQRPTCGQDRRYGSQDSLNQALEGRSALVEVCRQQADSQSGDQGRRHSQTTSVPGQPASDPLPGLPHLGLEGLEFGLDFGLVEVDQFRFHDEKSPFRCVWVNLVEYG